MSNTEIDRIKKNLKILKLTTSLETIDEELSLAVKESLAHTQLLDRIFEFEVQALMQRRMDRRIKDSKLPELKLLADFDLE